MAESSPSSSPSSVLLTSISSVDPSKRRTFTARYYTQPRTSTSTPAPSTSTHLPDSYFQPTAQELERAHAQAILHREHLVDRPLLTSKLRDQQLKDKQRIKATKFPKTTIRIRFHGAQSLLEGEFNSASDKLIHLYEFVKLALLPHLRHVPFTLYQSPPRTEYRRDDPTLRGKSLLDLDFAPSTSLNLKFLPAEGVDVDVDTLNATTTSPSELLIPELIKAATELPRPPSFDPPTTTTTTKTGDNNSPEEVSQSEEQKKRDKEERLRKLLGGGGGGKGKGGMFGGGGGKSEFLSLFSSLREEIRDEKRPLQPSWRRRGGRESFSHRFPQRGRCRKDDKMKGS